MKLFDLAGRKALVTGGSRGIGRGIAQGLKEAGAEVAVIGRSETVFQTAAEDGFLPIQADLGDREELRRGFEEATAKLRGLDILVNNHGLQRRHPAERFPLADWDLVIEVNLTSIFELCQLAAGIMLPRAQGKIINIASVLSFSGGITVPAYAAAKGGVAQMTKALANEWAGKGVNVNAIAPGYIATDLNEALINDPVRNRQILERVPAGRWGIPDDLKGVAIFLASPASDYVHGAVLPVDGGWLAR